MTKQDKLEKMGVKFTPINMNTLKIKLPNLNNEKIYEKNIISKITIDSLTITDEDCFIIKHGEFEIAYKPKYMKIYKGDETTIIASESNTNLATMFVLPLIFEEKKKSSFIYANKEDNKYYGYLIDVFLSCDKYANTNPNSVFLLLKFSKSNAFKEQENYFHNHKRFVQAIDINKYYVLYEFTIERKFWDDYGKMLEGKYSKISNIAKNRISNFHKESTEGVYTHNVINRTPTAIKIAEDKFGMSMKGMELCSKFGKNEVLNIGDYG